MRFIFSNQSLINHFEKYSAQKQSDGKQKLFVFPKAGASILIFYFIGINTFFKIFQTLEGLIFLLHAINRL